MTSLLLNNLHRKIHGISGISVTSFLAFHHLCFWWECLQTCEKKRMLTLFFCLSQNSMNLPPDKVRILRQYDYEKKWELICDQVRESVHMHSAEWVSDKPERNLTELLYNHILVRGCYRCLFSFSQKMQVFIIPNVNSIKPTVSYLIGKFNGL